jgi:hypothetical protein
MKGWRWTYFFDPDGISLELLQTNWRRSITVGYKLYHAAVIF